jgi:hypothetical protein
MSQNKERPHPFGGFSFTENERLNYRVSDARFQELFADAASTIHRMELSSNTYGEFLFVTLSRGGQQKKQPVTFYSQGYHEYRERWIHKEWYWYRANTYPSSLAKEVSREEAAEMLQQRVDEVSGWVTEETQTERGRLFEMLAELTDDDGAISEMQDLGDDLEQFFGDLQ